MAKRSRRSAAVLKTLQSSASPLFLLSDRRVVTFFNAGCEALTGWASADVVGRKCDYLAEPDSSGIDAIPATLCPPPEVFAGEAASVPAYLVHRDGRSFPRMIHFTPLFEESEGVSRVAAVLGVIGAIAAPRPSAPPTLAQKLHAELAAERAALRVRFGLKSVIARSESMLRVLRQVALAKDSHAPALLRGEPGVGREHLARVIHSESEARHRCFVPLECASLPAFELKQTLRRLFSHDPDDLRDASPTSSLLPGTLYLKDVERLPRDLQEFLVQQLSKGDATRSALRVLAGTAADLAAAVAGETVRSDLFHLLTPLEIVIPPLRQRVEEIPLLAQALLEERNRGAERQRGGFSDEVLRQFREYRWPGNVAELAAVVGEAWEAAAGSIIQPGDLPFRFRTGRDAQQAGPAAAPRAAPLEQYLEAVEKEQIERTLSQVRNNKSRAAELLGMPRPKLYRRMEALGIVDHEPDEPSPPASGTSEKS